ncbi:hypothetical protein HMPREF0628_0898 [Peptoniphilus lacrimalis 315-B]|uniref:Uncharacterized protein n=1 Tax=Peptoniphilus lacrimalis 315-B TaxID=596330 RepID=D1VVW2_9FIRM|nr:hypothetical protein HMPREF0628_0898 [Peptoniphilus lacrimalis 315-B]
MIFNKGLYFFKFFVFNVNQGLSLFPYQLLILIIKTQEKSGTVPFFKFFEFRQYSYFKSGDSPSRKIQQSAFASLGFLLRGTVLKDRPPLKQGLSIIKDFGLGLQRTGTLRGTILIIKTQEKSGTVPYPSSIIIPPSSNTKIRDCPFWDCPFSLINH